jgi:hypothetical protein
MDATHWATFDEWKEISRFIEEEIPEVESGKLPGETDLERVQRVMEGDDQDSKNFLTELMGGIENKYKKDEWRREMKEFHREIRNRGAGAFQTTIIRPEYQAWMIQNGEGRYLKMLANWSKVVKQGGYKPLCLGCEHEFKADDHVFAYAVSVPFCNEPESAIVTAICGECVLKDDEQLLEIAYGQYLKMGLANRKLEVGVA